VTLCGFSLQGGHAYQLSATPRNHAADRKFLGMADQLRCRFQTTSVELHDLFLFEHRRPSAEGPMGRERARAANAGLGALMPQAKRFHFDRLSKAEIDQIRRFLEETDVDELER
jgi:hypothetical protein